MRICPTSLPKKLFLLDLAQTSKAWAACAGCKCPWLRPTSNVHSGARSSPSFLLATAIPVEAVSWQREQGQLSLEEEPLPWNWWVRERWRMHPFSADTEDTFTPAGSRPGLPSPIYKAGSAGWMNSNEIILFIMHTVLPKSAVTC